jgi:hypothetical protein
MTVLLSARPSLLVAVLALSAALTAEVAPCCARDTSEPWVSASGTDFIASFAPAPQQDGDGTCRPLDDPETTATKAAVRPVYKLLRYDEDYSYLKDPSQSTDCWDPIKYIPLFGCDGDYLSIGGEIRERFEFYHNQNDGTAPADSHGNNGYSLERYLLHGDLHLGPYFRFFGQFVSGLEDGRIGGPRPDIDRDAFDVHQAFADFVLPLTNDNDTLTARLGRQEFEYGSGRLIDLRDGPNLRLSFDAARFLLHVNQWEVDGWWSKPVLNRTGVFDDEPDPEQSFWGLYAVHPFALLPKGNIDLYYLGFENEQAVYVQGSGAELRHSLGTRLWGSPLPWEYNLEYVWQFGTFGPGAIEAWTAAHAVRYNFSDLPLKPRVGLRFDVASGSRSQNSTDLGTFNPLFPSGEYFNLLNPVGPLNMIDLHPTVNLYAGKTVTLNFDWDFFWRESLGDGVYSIGGTPLRAGVAGGRYVGNSPAFLAAWNATPHLTLLVSYVHFFPGAFFDANPPDKPTDYFTTWLNYEF